MANRVFPIRHADPRGTQLWRSLGTEEMPWIHAPRFGWECTITDLDLEGDYATQSSTITVTSIESGRLTMTFSGGNLVAPVEVTADAAIGDNEDDFAGAIQVALDTAIGGDLAGTLVSATLNAPLVYLAFVEGIGIVDVDLDFAVAQQTTVTWGGTLVDGEYSVRFVCADPVADETVDNDRAAGSPADAAAMGVAFEAAAEALIGSTLAGVLVSADDDAGGVNTLIFEPGVTCTVTATVTNNTTHTFGGTATDGDYVTRFTHSSLPGGSLDITTTRVGGAPATNTDLADAFETDVEARALLAALLETADNTAGANVITFFAGFTGMDVAAVSAQAPGTLTVSDPTVAVADATPADPDITIAHSITVDLNSIAFDQGFPANVVRSWVLINVIEAFGASRTITIGDAGDPDGVLGSTPVDLNTTGRSGSVAADGEYQPRPEIAWVPTATIALGSSTTVSAGQVLIEVLFTPNMANVAAA